MKKIHIQLIFQLAAILMIASFFIFDQLDLTKLNFIFSQKIYGLLIFLILLKVFIGGLFFLIINIISEKKLNFIDISNTFLQGGIVNQLLPGAGLIFKYYKLKLDSDISIAEYSVSQSVLSLSSLGSYILLGILFGFIQIVSFNSLNIIGSVVISITCIFLLYSIRKWLYTIFRDNVLKFNIINNLYYELKPIKNIINNNAHLFIVIFSGFFFLSFLECYSFYLCIKAFGFNLDFSTSISLFISTSLITVVSMMNFIGFFELVLTVSASFISENYIDMIYLGLGFKILNTTALFIVILLNRILNYFYSRLKKI